MTLKLTRSSIVSHLRSALDPATPNLRVAPAHGEPPTVVKSARDSTNNNGDQAQHEPIILMDTSDLIGKTFLIDKEDGQKHRARIVEAIKNHEDKVHSNNTQFRCSVNDDQYEELLSYHQVMEHLEQQVDEDVLWQFEKIIGHQGPLKPSDPHYKGSNYNVMMKWSNGEITYEPLNIIAADSPVVCAQYAKDHGLLNLPGWKRFRRLAGRQDRMLRMAKPS